MLLQRAFTSGMDFDKAGKEHGREIFADIQNFTNGTPVVRINEPLA